MRNVASCKIAHSIEIEKVCGIKLSELTKTLKSGKRNLAG